jgi:hypothetical protein
MYYSAADILHAAVVNLEKKKNISKIRSEVNSIDTLLYFIVLWILTSGK